MKAVGNMLLPQHAKSLAESGISQDVIEARGYRSVESKAELERLGFSQPQRLTPTLLVPIWGRGVKVGLYHHRPDEPRMNKDRARFNKYEVPYGSQMVVDVHPFLKDKIKDPKVPLFITEGIKKADAAISRGLCCIALIGTWNWRGTTEFGGKTVLTDFEFIAFKDSKDHGRDVYICFDSDVMEKPQVNLALARLSEVLK